MEAFPIKNPIHVSQSLVDFFRFPMDSGDGCDGMGSMTLTPWISPADFSTDFPMVSASTFDLPGEVPSCVTRSGSFAEEMPSFHQSPGEEAAKTSADRWAWELQKNHDESDESMVILWDLMVI